MTLVPVVSMQDDYPAYLVDSRTSESDSESVAASHSRILVVDDERILADSTAAILNRAGFTAKAAYDGFGALELVPSFRPDYLLTDVMMPEMNGVELAIAVMKMRPGTKILLFSGQTGISKILEECKAQGFEFPLLAKPVHPTKLLEGLRAME